jgi:hypothetical protein
MKAKCICLSGWRTNRVAEVRSAQTSELVVRVAAGENDLKVISLR